MNLHPEELLEKYWGYRRFRPMQAEIVAEVLKGHSILAVLPTGAGKSVCYQVPGLMLKGVVLVISPLIALMRDQVSDLLSRRISACAITSALSAREADLALDEAVAGKYKFLYVSPERLHTEIFQARFRGLGIGLIVIDEAHCISSWGHDFRPAYGEIAAFTALLPDVPVMALTATAPPKVRADILESLQLLKPKVFVQGFARPNLSYSVFKTENKETRLLEIVSKVPGPVLVYARSRNKTEDYCDLLKKNGQNAAHYHAGLKPEERTATQHAWFADKVRILVATNAFGLGINKPDVRLVLHTDLPESLEAYVQESGRAGRDGQKAYAVALYAPGEPTELPERAAANYPDSKELGRVYQALANFYEVAKGSNLLTSYPFNFVRFCTNFNLKSAAAYTALKRLEAEGLIALSDAELRPSRVLLRGNEASVYEYRVAHPDMDPLLKILQRDLGADAYRRFHNLNENKLAQLLNKRAIEVERLLKKMAVLGILDYSPYTQTPLLTFTMPRQDPAHLPINYASLAQRKAADLHRAHAVADYVQNTLLCRMAQLAAAFGEADLPECKICDVCLAKAKKAKQTDSLALRERLAAGLKAGQSAAELLNKLPEALRAEALEQLRRLNEQKAL